MKSAVLVCISAIALVFVGCAKEKSAGTKSTNAAQNTIRVGIVGDQTRNSMLTMIGSTVNANVEEHGNVRSVQFLAGDKTIRIESAADDNLIHHAKIASRSNIVLLAVNVADGPLPIHREHAILVRQMDVPQAMMLFTQCDLVEDPELFELIELEMRELFNTYGLPGDAAVCAFDRENAKTSSKSKIPKGPKEIIGYIAKNSTALNRTLDTKSTHSFIADVYSLAKKEAPQGAMTIAAGTLTIILDGIRLEAEVEKTNEIAPGSRGQLQVKLKDSINTSLGQRFIILNQNHIAGVGNVAEILD